MISLDDVLRPSYLRKVHKAMRKNTRDVHLTTGFLVKDPTLLAAAEYELDTTMRLIGLRVADGSYRAQPAQIVESAKAAGLRRPLTYLHHADAMLIKALCKAAQEGLLSDFPPWVSFGRKDTGQKKKKGSKDLPFEVDSDYEGWFVKWLRYRKLLSLIAGDPRPQVVISDVANFFPSVDLLFLRDRFNRANALDTRATDLLFYMIDSIRAASPSGSRAPLGLPQDPYDASRILAHFFLKPVDDVFRDEGAAGRYTRWVDDIAISVEDTLEGQDFIVRIQSALRELGLHPNSGKTHVISKDDFRREHYEHYNELLDIVHNLTGQSAPTPILKAMFEQRLRRFLLESPRLRYWYRVLRRFYTESRRARSGTLANLAATHLREFPAESPHIFDYLAFHPDSRVLPDVFFEHVRREGRLYEDVQILGYEALLAAAFPDDGLLRWRIVRDAYHHFLGVDGFQKPSAYTRALVALTLYKFGAANGVKLLSRSFSATAEESVVFARQGFLVLYAVDAYKDGALEAIRRLDDPVLNQIERFVLALEAGDDKALGLTLGLLEPRETKAPTRLVSPARALPLLAICRRATAKLPQIGQAVASVRNKLAAQADEHRDDVFLSHL